MNSTIKYEMYLLQLHVVLFMYEGLGVRVSNIINIGYKTNTIYQITNSHALDNFATTTRRAASFKHGSYFSHGSRPRG